MNEEDEKNKIVIKIIEYFVYIVSIFYLITYSIYAIYTNINYHYLSKYIIMTVFFTIFTYAYNHLINIKSLHKKIYIEEIIITIFLFTSILILNQLNYLVFLLFPMITLTLIILGMNIKETMLYMAINILGVLILIIDPSFSSIQNRFYLTTFMSINILVIIVNINYLNIYKTFTNKYKNEIYLKVQNDELNKEKDEFFEIASQELVTPIDNTSNAVEEILYRYKNDLSENISNTLSKMLTNIRILKQLSQNMLSIKTLNIENISIDIEEYDTKKLIREVIETMDPKAKERNSDITSNIDPNTKNIHIDPNRMGEVLRNLLDNAIKYSPTNSIIKINAYTKNDTTVIEIVDNGIGIPQKDIPHLFEKFYRASNVEMNTKQGSGIGLYLVKEYIEKMKGNIYIISNINKGTTFRIEIQ